MQNTAARIITQTGKFQHITPVLVEFHWLPVSYRIVFKILLTVYKSLNGQAPCYLQNLLKYSRHSRTLRSGTMEFLFQPKPVIELF